MYSQKALDKYYENPLHCLQCGKVIEANVGNIDYRRKFCGHSCSAVFNNKGMPKKRGSLVVPIHKCEKCGSCIPENEKRRESLSKSQFTLCKKCRRCLIDRKTKGSVLNKEGSRRELSVSITRNARGCYINSGRPMVCAECGYSAHVDVCHVKSIESFDDSVVISEINSGRNLVALCKNHHWEFDHGFLEWNPEWK